MISNYNYNRIYNYIRNYIFHFLKVIPWYVPRYYRRSYQKRPFLCSSVLRYSRVVSRNEHSVFGSPCGRCKAFHLHPYLQLRARWAVPGMSKCLEKSLMAFLQVPCFQCFFHFAQAKLQAKTKAKRKQNSKQKPRICLSKTCGKMKPSLCQ